MLVIIQSTLIPFLFHYSEKIANFQSFMFGVVDGIFDTALAAIPISYQFRRIILMDMISLIINARPICLCDFYAVIMLTKNNLCSIYPSTFHEKNRSLYGEYFAFRAITCSASKIYQPAIAPCKKVFALFYLIL